MFAAAEGCLYDDSTGLDPADAAVALFNAQAWMNEFVHRSLGNSEYIWPLLPSARTWVDRRNEARRQADLPALSPEDSREDSPIETTPPGPSISSSTTPAAGPSRVTRRSAAAAVEAAASASAAPRSRSSSSSFELQTSRPRPKRGGKPVNLSTTKRG